MFQKIGIICAMDKEFSLLRSALSHGHTEQVGKYTFYLAEQEGKQVVAAVSGIGKVNAAVCAQIMALHFQVECILNSGICGALSEQLHRMDMVIASELLYHDLADEHLLDYTPRCARFCPDEELVDLLEKICAAEGFASVRKRIASGDQFILDENIKRDIALRTKADAIEMEGAAVAHSCYLTDLPFAVLRCVSDGLSDSEMDYNTFASLAAERCARVTLSLIHHM